MSNKFSWTSAIAVGAAGFLLAASIFLPWWGMKFIAPQYPEGLDIIVYPTKLEGRIDIINGLNHYIGMREFSEETFPELRYLPYLIAGLAALVEAAALTRSRVLLYICIGLLLVGGAAGIYDISWRLTDFGTNLDPNAPIKIEPFVPPILGDNQVANFVTHSYFSYGAFLVASAFLLLFVPLWRDRRR